MTPHEPNIPNNICKILAKLHAAEQAAGRTPDSVSLLAVSKTQSLESIQAAFQSGLHRFGENRVQEAIEKQLALKDLAIEWHFIGRIQTNKTTDIAKHFAWVHGLDCLKKAKKINDARRADQAPLNVCIQVNGDNEPQKGGISLTELPMFAASVNQLPQLKLRGLMVLPKLTSNMDETRMSFRRVAQAQQALIQSGMTLDTLSMGMSGDFECAIECGATIVRIGSGIFGPRK